MSILFTEKLCVSIKEVPILKDISCAVKKGHLTGLIGPNGAGKTTLLRALLRLQPLERGRVLWKGVDITDRRSHELSHEFAYLAQSQTVHWPITIDSLVALGRRPFLAPLSRMSTGDHRIIDRALQQTGLESMRDRAITTLSGGERARALLARVLASDAEVVLADEPVAALDPYHQLSILKILKDWSTRGHTVLIVLHDLSLARQFCDDIILLHQGEVEVSGPSPEVLTKPNLDSTYGVDFRLGEGGSVLPRFRIKKRV